MMRGWSRIWDVPVYLRGQNKVGFWEGKKANGPMRRTKLPLRV